MQWVDFSNLKIQPYFDPIALRARGDIKTINLSTIDLSSGNLSGANLSSGNLSGANLSGANLNMANLSWANLSGANLSGANLSGANLNRAYLSAAIIIVNEQNYQKASVSDANFENALINDSGFLEYLRENGAKNVPDAVSTKDEFINWMKQRGFDIRGIEQFFKE